MGNAVHDDRQSQIVVHEADQHMIAVQLGGVRVFRHSPVFGEIDFLTSAEIDSRGAGSPNTPFMQPTAVVGDKHAIQFVTSRPRQVGVGQDIAIGGGRSSILTDIAAADGRTSRVVAHGVIIETVHLHYDSTDHQSVCCVVLLLSDDCFWDARLPD